MSNRQHSQAQAKTRSAPLEQKVGPTTEKDATTSRGAPILATQNIRPERIPLLLTATHLATTVFCKFVCLANQKDCIVKTPKPARIEGGIEAMSKDYRQDQRPQDRLGFDPPRSGPKPTAERMTLLKTSFLTVWTGICLT